MTKKFYGYKWPLKNNKKICRYTKVYNLYFLIPSLIDKIFLDQPLIEKNNNNNKIELHC